MSRQIVNIINFIRGCEPRCEVDLYEPVRQQLALLRKHDLPGTFLIKGLDALVASLIFRAMGRTSAAAVVSGVVGELIMVGGYFVYEALPLQYGIGAAVGIPSNLVQALVGLVIGFVLLKVFQKARIAEKI